LSDGRRARVVVVDDEPPARKRLRRLLADDDRAELVGEAGDGLAAVELLERERPDIAFLDIQMPELDGFEVLEEVEGGLPRIVFVTAYDEFALRAFEIAAVDYLLKPVERARFNLALDRALEAIATQVDPSAAALAAVRRHVVAARPLTRFLVRRANRMLLVPADSVRWLEAARNYVRLHVGGSGLLVRGTLSDLERRLDPERFVRIHRSAILNLDVVERFEPASHGDWRVILHDGETLRLSRRYRDRLEGVFGV